jgi:hypothetical protein
MTFLSERLDKARTNLTVSTELWAAGHLTTDELAEAIEAFNDAETMFFAGRYPDIDGLKRRDPARFDRVAFRGRPTATLPDSARGTVVNTWFGNGRVTVELDEGGGRFTTWAQSWAPQTDGSGRVIERALPVR